MDVNCLDSRLSVKAYRLLPLCFGLTIAGPLLGNKQLWCIARRPSVCALRSPTARNGPRRIPSAALAIARAGSFFPNLSPSRPDAIGRGVQVVFSEKARGGKA